MAGDGTIWIKVAVQGATQAKAELQGLSNQTNESSKSMADWGTKAGVMALGAAGVAAGVAAMVIEIGNAADALLDLSERTGIAAGNLKVLQDTCVATGVDFTSVSMSLDIFNRGLGSTGEEAIKFQAELSKIGVNTEGKNVSEVLQETVTALKNIEDPSTRAATAFALFGRGYKEILNLTPEVIANLNNTGGAVDGLTLKLIAQKKAADTLNGTINALGNFLGEGLSRAIDTVTMKGDFMYSDYLSVGDAAFQSMYKMTKKQYEATEAFARKQAEATTELKQYNAGVTTNIQLNKAAAAALEEKALATEKVATATKEATKLDKDWAAGFVGSAGSNMQLFMQAEMNKGLSYQDALQAWSQGTPSNQYGAQFTAGGQSMSVEEPPEIKANNKVKESLTELADAHVTSYTKIEELGFKHYTAMSGYEKVYYDTLMKHHQTATDYVSNTVQWVQQISVVNGNPQATPRAYVTAAPPVLEAANYSGIAGVSGAASAAAAIGGAGGVQKVQVEVKVETADTLKASTSVAKKIGSGADYSSVIV